MVRDIIDNLTLPLGPRIFIFHICHSVPLPSSFSSAHCSAAVPECLLQYIFLKIYDYIALADKQVEHFIHRWLFLTVTVYHYSKDFTGFNFAAKIPMQSKF